MCVPIQFFYVRNSLALPGSLLTALDLLECCVCVFFFTLFGCSVTRFHCSLAEIFGDCISCVRSFVRSMFSIGFGIYCYVQLLYSHSCASPLLISPYRIARALFLSKYIFGNSNCVKHRLRICAFYSVFRSHSSVWCVRVHLKCLYRKRSVDCTFIRWNREIRYLLDAKAVIWSYMFACTTKNTDIDRNCMVFFY